MIKIYNLNDLINFIKINIIQAKLSNNQMIEQIYPTEYKRILQYTIVSLKGGFQFFALQCTLIMQSQHKSAQQILSDFKQQQSQLSCKSSTIGNLVDAISFEKKKTKPIKKNTLSETSSISSNQSAKSKQKSKLWSQEENLKFQLLIKKHGPDFQLLGKFFQKKSKNQLKTKYKQMINNEKKKTKQEEKKIKAVTVGSLFQQVDEKQEYN